MAANPATVYSAVLTQLVGNTSGAVESLPNSNLNGAPERVAVATYTTAAETSGTAIGMCRIPLPAVLTGITISTDTTLGSSTVAIGDSGSGNSAIYAAAATLTSTNTPTKVGKVSGLNTPITAGVDCVSGLATTSYEDIVITVGAATFPTGAKLLMQVEYTTY